MSEGQFVGRGSFTVDTDSRDRKLKENSLKVAKDKVYRVWTHCYPHLRRVGRGALFLLLPVTLIVTTHWFPVVDKIFCATMIGAGVMGFLYLIGLLMEGFR